MLRKDFILCKTRNLLNEFIRPITTVADKPRQRFLRQTLKAILLSGSLVVTELAFFIHDKCSDRFYTLKRLLNHLTSTRGDLTPVVTAYHQTIRRFIQPDTPILIDVTDIAKPRARKMKYLKLVYDGSESRLVPGYWCVEVYAHLKNKRILPLVMDTFGIDDPAAKSMNCRIISAIETVNKDFSGNGIWVADRGFDRLNLLETWISQSCNFVVRQRGDRCVVTPNGVRIIVSDLVEHLRQQRATTAVRCNVVFCKVRLPDNPKSLYVVSSWLPGKDRPLILLTSMVVENIEQAGDVIRHYKQRWVCEEAGRFLKSHVGLERFRIRRYEAIQRLVILAMLAMAFLTWILLRSRQLAGSIFSLTSRFRKKSKFVYYRLLDGLQEFGRLYRLRLGKIPLEPLENG